MSESPAKRKRLLMSLLRIAGLTLLLGFVGYRCQPMDYDVIPGVAEQSTEMPVEATGLLSNASRVALVTAHPDDAEFYCGGLLTKLASVGAEVHLIVLTDGDKASYFWQDTEGIARTRRAEQLACAKEWKGRSVEFLGYPDTGLRGSDAEVRRVAELLRKLNPTHVLAFDPDFPTRVSHRDHRTAGDIAARASAGLGSVRWRLLFESSSPNVFVNVDKEWDQKEKLLALHASEFSGEKLQRVLGTVQSTAIELGERANCTYAEGLRAVQSK